MPIIVYSDLNPLSSPITPVNQTQKKLYKAIPEYHNPSNFCYYIKCFDSSVYSNLPRYLHCKNQGDDVAKKFVEMMEQSIKDIYHKFRIPKKMLF